MKFQIEGNYIHSKMLVNSLRVFGKEVESSHRMYGKEKLNLTDEKIFYIILDTPADVFRKQLDDVGFEGVRKYSKKNLNIARENLLSFAKQNKQSALVETTNSSFGKVFQDVVDIINQQESKT